MEAKLIIGAVVIMILRAAAGAVVIVWSMRPGRTNAEREHSLKVLDRLKLFSLAGLWRRDRRP